MCPLAFRSCFCLRIRLASLAPVSLPVLQVKENGLLRPPEVVLKQVWAQVKGALVLETILAFQAGRGAEV